MMNRKRWVAFVLGLLVVLGVLSGCGNGQPQTVEGFTRVMTEAGLSVRDITDEAQIDDLDAVMLAAELGEHKLLFMEFTESAQCSMMYSVIKTGYEDDHNSRLLNKELSRRKNVDGVTYEYEHRSFLADGNFHYVTRINNTLLFCELPKEYRTQINELAEALGYD